MNHTGHDWWKACLLMSVTIDLEASACHVQSPSLVFLGNSIRLIGELPWNHSISFPANGDL